jgi:hypothetical protein
MNKLNRTSRRAAIGRVEQLDERIALSGMTAATHSGPIVSPVSAYPPFFFNYSNIYGPTGHYNPPGSGATIPTSATITDGVPVTTPINGTAHPIPIAGAPVSVPGGHTFHPSPGGLLV